MKKIRIQIRNTEFCCYFLTELKAVKGDKNLPAVKIRAIAAQFAAKTVSTQQAQFATWGLLTDWAQTYRTMDPTYVEAQLRSFYQIYERGLVFRDYMPVYWSPSSKTALAEAELEYNPRHVSTAVYMRFRLLKRPADVVSGNNSGELFAVIWTTTPWSLLANRAICYNAGDDYTVLEWEGDQYIVSAALVDSAGVKAALPGARPVVSSFPGRLLKGERALVKYGVISQSLCGLHVHSCTVLIG
jgi:isoleucyl-tRNA synthetase